MKSNTGKDNMLLVLIVDYDTVQSKISMENLREKFPEVSFAVANDGQTALKIIREQAPDLTLTDLQMPGLNGFTLLRKLRQEESTKDLPVMVLGGVRDFDSVRLAVSLGADDFIAKPVNFHVLTRRINQIVKRKQRGLPLRQNHRSYKRREIFEEVEARILVTGIHEKFFTVYAPGKIPPGTSASCNLKPLCDALRVHFTDEPVKCRSKKCVESQGGYLIDLFADSLPDRYFQAAENFRKIEGMAARVLGNPYEPVWIGLVCKVLDISGGGLKIETPWPFPESSIMRISMRKLFSKLQITSEDSIMSCIVRHSPKAVTGRFQCGLEFADIDPDIQSQVMRWCVADSSLPKDRG